MEYLYSDEGQLGWASGFCYPIRYNAMLAAGTIPADVAAQLPSTEGAYFPTIEEITAAKAVITEGWPTVVGVEVK
jgi:putative spermidine/putrescine transport system substrate-binding protein